MLIVVKWVTMTLFILFVLAFISVEAEELIALLLKKFRKRNGQED